MHGKNISNRDYSRTGANVWSSDDVNRPKPAHFRHINESSCKFGTDGGVAQTALQPGGVLSQTINTLGQTVQRTVDATGNILEKTLDTTGKVVNSNTVGNVTNLRVLGETKNAAGQTLRRVQDTAGGVIELTLDAAQER